MKAIAYDGVAAVTTDEAADALMELALTVARFGVYERATLPVLVAGVPEQLTLMLGPTIHLSTVTTSEPTTVPLIGVAEAVASLQDRQRSLGDPLRWLNGPAIELDARTDG